MGSTQSPPPSSCRLFASISTCLEPPSPYRPRTASATISGFSSRVGKEELTLLDFEQALLTPECFYVLSALLQQYYALFKRSGKVWISAGACAVSQLGEVAVNGQNEDQKQISIPAVSLVSAVSQILQVVQGLSSQSEGSDDCAYFRERLLKAIYRFHSDDDLLYQELMGEVFSYMQFCRYRTNLLPALLRRLPQQPLLQKRSAKQTHKRYESASFESFALREHERTMGMSAMTKKEAPLSLLGRQQDRKHTLYHRKNAHTEGEEYFQGMAKDQTFQNDSTARYNPPPLPQRNHISSQFSINIANCHQQDSPRNKAKVKFRKITKRVHYAHDHEGDQQPHLRRHKTMNQPFQAQESKLMHTKSVLEDLARSVIVRDEPSSKSFIF